MFDKIVVGFAGDQDGRDAVTLAGRLAAGLSSHVTIVLPYNPLLAELPAAEAREYARGQVQELVADIDRLPTLTYRSTSARWPIHALHDVASKEKADLIVFGAAREGLAAHMHVNLVERMLHRAPCAVAIAPSGYAERDHGGLHRIGVGLSDSQEGRAALHLAYELAGHVAGELEVISSSGVNATLASYAFSSALLPQFEDEMYDEAKAKLERTESELGDNVQIDLKPIRGDAHTALIKCSANLDMLMLGSHAYGPLRNAVLGSFSAAVIREAHCPVLVVPRSALGSAAFTETQA
ncbi:MAG TPA: universal stress protein [Solirubrobacteraceae bacterium]